MVTVNRDPAICENSMLLDQFMPRWISHNALCSIIAPPALSRYRHMRHFALTVVAVVVLDVTLRCAMPRHSSFCLLAGFGDGIWPGIILTNKCAEECPELPGTTGRKAAV